jgi:uncharacterized protein YggE
MLCNVFGDLMAENSMLVVGIIAVVLLTAGLTYFLAKAGTPIVQPLPNQTNLSGPTPTITVTGEASRTVSPDLLDVGLTISTMGQNTSGSQSKNAAETAAVKAALLAAGVNESEIQTVSYYTSPVYNESCSSCYAEPYYSYGAGQGGVAVPSNGATAGSAPAPVAAVGSADASSGAVSGGSASSGGIVSPGYPIPSPPPPCLNKDNCAIIGYKTVHSIEIKSEKTADGGKYAEAALNASNSTSVDYVYFSLTEATRIGVDSELQAEAASSAKAKAENIAKGLGASLGKIVSVNPNYYPIYPVYAYQNAGTGTAAPAAPPTEIFPTTTDMSSSITVVYELVQ